MLILSLSSLFASSLLLQLSSGALGPLDVLSGIELAFSTSEIGLLGSAHFLGFFIGCWWGPRLIGQIGHSRAFAVFAAAGTLGVLLHMLWINAQAWAAMRILSGLCVAGSFTVIEAWIQAKVTNSNRARILGVYRVVDLVGGIAAQSIIFLLTPAHYVAYNVLAIFACAALLPLVLTRIPPPELADDLRLNLLMSYRISPVAVGGVFVAGVTTAGFRMVGPIYAARMGFDSAQIGIFLSSFLLGGAIAQYPVGWLADRNDRRWVLIGLSVGAIGACFLATMLSTSGSLVIFANTIGFGLMTFPIYSVAAAHANDHVERHKAVELNASLLFFFALGAILSPLLISSVLDAQGVNALFTIIGAAHLGLVVFGLYRMTRTPGAKARTRYTYTPRTSFLIGRLLRRNRRNRQ